MKAPKNISLGKVFSSLLLIFFLFGCENSGPFLEKERSLYCSEQFQEAFLEAALVPNFWFVQQEEIERIRNEVFTGVLKDVGKDLRENINDNYDLLTEGRDIKKWKGDIFLSDEFRDILEPIVQNLNQHLLSVKGPQFYFVEKDSEAKNFEIFLFEDLDLAIGYHTCITSSSSCQPHQIWRLYRIGHYDYLTGSEKNPLQPPFIFYKDATVFITSYPLNRDEYYSKHVQGFIVSDENLEIKAAECSIYKGHSSDIKTALLEECLVRGLGLPGVVENEKNSLLNQRAFLSEVSPLPRISGNDLQILKILFSQEIKAGMTRQEAVKAIKNICSKG